MSSFSNLLTKIAVSKNMANDPDEEFSVYLAIARDLILDIHDKSDMKICTKWIQKLCNLQSDDIDVKKNRNYFFKYLLEVMRDEAEEVAARLITSGNVSAAVDNDNYHNFSCYWSADHKTYVACQPIPGRGALIYMAVSDDPALGWDFSGLKKRNSPKACKEKV